MEAVLALEPDCNPGCEAGFESLREARARLATTRLQVAVLGQFKRGKSSLLNALLGFEILPTGVLPVTAISTFLEGAATPAIEAVYADGRSEPIACVDVEGLRVRLAALVTEAENPDNRLGLSRVVVRAPSPLLEAGVVFMDTPGIGSTHQHNTEAAEATLPYVDAALLVLSPDPPITEAECDYLTRIQATAAHVLIALNKSDLVAEDDLATVIGFTRSVLARAGLPEPQIIPVSARTALEAARAGPNESAGGIEAIRSAMIDLIRSRGAGLLARSIAKKARAVIEALAFHTELKFEAGRSPLERLTSQMTAFKAFEATFATERQSLRDQIAGDRSRLLEALDEAAGALRGEIRKDLEDALDAAIAGGEAPRQAWDRLRQSIGDLFSRRQVSFTQAQRSLLEAALARHQVRADALLDEVRRTAADLFGVPYAAPAGGEAFELRFTPYWIDRPRETLSAAPAGLMERALPGPLGRRYARERVRREIEEIAIANVESLRWSTRMNVEETLRRFARELDDTLAQGVDAVARGLDSVAQARTEGEGAVRLLEAKLRKTLDDLSNSLRVLKMIIDQRA